MGYEFVVTHAKIIGTGANCPIFAVSGRIFAGRLPPAPPIWSEYVNAFQLNPNCSPISYGSTENDAPESTMPASEIVLVPLESVNEIIGAKSNGPFPPGL